MSIALENWWLVIASLVAIKSWKHFFILLLPLALIFLSMGPCPDVSIGKSAFQLVWEIFPSLHCVITYIHDLNRLAMIGLLMIPFCYVLCTKRNTITTTIFVLITAHLVWRSYQEIGTRHLWWKADESNSIMTHIEEHQPSVIVELPFDQSLQFISAIHHPNVARINPWTMNATPSMSNESLHFLYEVGYERPVTYKPSKIGLLNLGLDFVYYDTKRCRTSAHCHSIPEDYITRVLGSPTILDDGSLVWEIPPK